MSEPKPFASLSSGLLARKGAARPAMRPQGFTQQNTNLDDLGWNDMGHEETGEQVPYAAGGDHVVEHPRAYHPTGLTPISSPVHSQQAEIADRFADDGEEEYDEEYDETAEYEPEDAKSGFAGCDQVDDDEAEAEAVEETEFRVQFKKPGRPLEEYGLTGRPAEELPAPSFAPVQEDAAEIEEDILELEEAVGEAASLPEVNDRRHEFPAAIAPSFDVKTAPAPQFAGPAIKSPASPPAPRRSRTTGQGKAKAAFTLRLDPQRHLKLRLACAVDGRSAQQLVTDALDQLLGGMPELDDLADKARRG